MATAAVVEVLITGKNNLSPTMRRASADIDQFEKQNSKALRSVEKQFERLGGPVAKFGTIYGGLMGAAFIGTTVLATRAIVRFGTESIKAFETASEASILSSSIFTGRFEEVIKKQQELKRSTSELSAAFEARKLQLGETLAPFASSVKQATAGVIAPEGFNPAQQEQAQRQMQFEERRAALTAAIDAETLYIESTKRIAEEVNKTIPNAGILEQEYIKQRDAMISIIAISPERLKALQVQTEAEIKVAEKAREAAAAIEKAADAFSKFDRVGASLSIGKGRSPGEISGNLTMGSNAAGQIFTGREAQISKQRAAKSGGGVKSKLATGGNVLETGLVQVEAGERVMPRSMASGGDVNVTMNISAAGMDPHRLALEIKRELATLT